MIHARRLQSTQELPGVGAERFNVPSLTFGVDRVDGEAALAAAAGTGAERDCVSGNLTRDVLSSVLCGPDDGDNVARLASRSFTVAAWLGTRALSVAARFGKHFA